MVSASCLMWIQMFFWIHICIFYLVLYSVHPFRYYWSSALMMYLGSQELYGAWREQTKVCHSDMRCRRYNHILFLNLVDLLAEATETSCLCSDLWWCFPSGCEWFSGLHVSGQSCLRMDTDQRSCSGTDQQEVFRLGEALLLTHGDSHTCWECEWYTTLTLGRGLERETGVIKSHPVLTFH